MPRDSNGNYSLPSIYLAVTGQTVLAEQHNAPLQDVAAALTGSIPRNGSAGFTAPPNFGGYRGVNSAPGEAPTDLVTLAQVQALIGQISGAITGELKLMTGTPVPAGYLRANGQSVLRATYPDLWTYAQASGNLAATEGAKTIGQYGPGDGSTTFTVPNLYADGGYFIRPMGSGRTIGSVQVDELKSHAHTGSTSTNGAHSHTYYRGANNNEYFGQNYTQTIQSEYATSTSVDGAHNHSLNIDASGGAETRPKNVAYPVLIKT